VVTTIVVVVHELRDRDFQIPWNIVWDLVDVKFDGPVIPLELAVGLRMERRCQDVAHAHQAQVFSEGTKDTTRPLSDSSLVRRSQGTSVMREVDCVLDYLDERV
jgi:hypothetical protein